MVKNGSLTAPLCFLRLASRSAAAKAAAAAEAAADAARQAMAVAAARAPAAVPEAAAAAPGADVQQPFFRGEPWKLLLLRGLAGFKLDVLTFITNALAFVGIRRPEGLELSSSLTDDLAVASLNGKLRALLYGDADTDGKWKHNLMAEAE